MDERDFQKRVIRKLKERYPECIVLKNDASYKQGVPDLIVLYGNQWATLECKKSKKASRQPNQAYYVDVMDRMSFSEFIYPENIIDVFRRLDDFFCLDGDF